MSETTSTGKKISYFSIVAISAMLILSLLALLQVVDAYARNRTLDVLSMALSASAIALSLYMLAQMRRKPLKLGFEAQKVFTTVQCTSCDYKNTREFQTGDYIPKEAGPCPKCTKATITSSIYRLAEEKEKQAAPSFL